MTTLHLLQKMNVPLGHLFLEHRLLLEVLVHPYRKEQLKTKLLPKLLNRIIALEELRLVLHMLIIFRTTFMLLL